MQKLLNPRTLPHFIRNKKNIKFAFGVTMETILRPEGSIFRSTSSFLHTLYPSMLLQKIVMERSDWKKKKKRENMKGRAPSGRKKGRWMPRRRYKFDTYETQLHFWRVLSIIGDRPAIIAYRGFLSGPKAK